MKRPAVFFDRDNTLIANDGYLGDPAGVALIYGAADAVARVRALGFAAVTFSNQSGVARGLFTEDAVHAVNARLDQLLKAQNNYAVLDRHEFCPYHPEAVLEGYRKESELRKPNPGMILHAADQLELDLSKSWVIGDAPRDIAAGKAAGCRTILFNDHEVKKSPAADEAYVAPDFSVASFYEAADLIERYSKMSPEELRAATSPAPSNCDSLDPSSMPTANENEQDSLSFTDPAAAPPTAPADSGEPIAPAARVVSSDDAPPGIEKALIESLQSEVYSTPRPAEAHTEAAPSQPRKMTFAERVRAGTFQPARGASGPVAAAVADSPKRLIPTPAEPVVPVTAIEQAVAADPDPTVDDISTPAPKLALVPAEEQIDDVDEVPPAPVLAPIKPLLPKPAPQGTEALLKEILEEIRRLRHPPSYPDFSVTKLLAGITQVLVLPVLFFGYLHRDTTGDLQSMLTLAVFLQMLTLSLLIMGKQQ